MGEVSERQVPVTRGTPMRKINAGGRLPNPEICFPYERATPLREEEIEEYSAMIFSEGETNGKHVWSRRAVAEGT